MAVLIPKDVPLHDLHTLQLMIRINACLRFENLYNYVMCILISSLDILAAYFSNDETAVFARPCLSVPNHCPFQYLTDHTNNTTLILVRCISDREKCD